MKYTISLLLFTFSVVAFSQRAKIYIKNGENASDIFIVDQVTSHTDDLLLCKDNDYYFNNITAVIFFQEPSNEMSDLLKSKGIKVIDRYSDDLYAGEPYRSLPQNFTPSASSRKSKVFQFAGIGLLTSAVVLSVTDLPEGSTLEDLKERQNLIKTLAICGGVGFTIGLFID